LSAENINY